jgi:hypothetical protein
LRKIGPSWSLSVVPPTAPRLQVMLAHETAALLVVYHKPLLQGPTPELDRGSAEATAKVAQSLFQMATSGKNVAEAIFRMKCRDGWCEKSTVEQTGLPQILVVTGVPRAGRPTDEPPGRIVASGPEEDEPDA